MIQGTCSDAGKSVLTAALCRIFLQDGYHVAPFKAQNMALNSGVTALGEEMGRAQLVQAQACRIDPDARMNPILLKPHSNTGSQVIVMGRPVGRMDAREYFTAKRRFWPDVCKAYDSLADEYELLCLEGAGSPGEINLKSADVVNMNMARYARARVLLAGDIDRGGVYASFLGTWMTFAPWEKELLAGFVVNKFRGDPDLLAPAHSYMRNRTGKPVLGVIPMMRDINIPEEDRATLPPGHGEHGKHADCLDVAVVMPAHVSNFTDFAPLAAEPDVRSARCGHGRNGEIRTWSFCPALKAWLRTWLLSVPPGWKNPSAVMPKRESGFWASAEGCKCWGRTFWTRCTWNPRRSARQDWGCWNFPPPSLQPKP